MLRKIAKFITNVVYFFLFFTLFVAGLTFIGTLL